MTRLFQPLVAAMLAAAVGAAHAESSIASSASDSISTSFAKISDSISGSSNSSSNKLQAQGDYKVTDVAAADGRPGMLKLRLEPLTPGQGEALFLTLPEVAAQHGGVGAGTIVTALARPYGTEFATGTPHQAFFIAVNDDWAREFQTTPLSL